jgi:CRP-like cAMP-binding protein
MAGERHADGERLDLRGRASPSSFDVRVHVLEPGCERPYDAAEWRDALVEVDRGEVDLEFRSGNASRFGAGDVLWLCGLELRALHNRGRVPAVLVALFRRRLDEKPGRCRLNMHDDNRATPKA